MKQDDDLERLLGRYAWSGDVPELPELPDRTSGSPRPPARGGPPGAHTAWLRPLTLAAAVIGVLALGALWLLADLADRARDALIESGRYPVARVDGGERSALSRGDALVSGAGESFEVAVGDIGRLVLGPDSRLVAVAPTGAGARHQFRLEVGSARASIVAVPRAFQLETPAGLAVDLGCEYLTEVAADGGARVAVVSGMVAFEREGQRVLVPAGAEIAVGPGAGFVLPIWTDAEGALAEATRTLASPAVAPARLADALAALTAAGPTRGSLALYHLLDHPDPAVVAEAWEHLVQLVDPPAAATRERTLAGQASARRLWERRLPWTQ